MVVGSPTTIADYMQEIFEAGGGDGFVILPNLFPMMFEEFGRMVVPELQRRGLFRTEYTGRPCARISGARAVSAAIVELEGVR